MTAQGMTLPTADKVAVITAGATCEPLDDVRHITNLASGRLPASIADQLLQRGFTVHYIHGPGAVLPGRSRAPLVFVEQTEQELEAALGALSARIIKLRERCSDGRLLLHPITTAADAAATLPRVVGRARPAWVMCAMAVADYTCERRAGKLPSTDDSLLLRLVPTEKTIDLVKIACPEAKLLGFKLLSGATRADQRAACLHLARRSGADAVFCNDVLDYGSGLRRGSIFDRHGGVKAELDGGDSAERLAEILVAHLLA